MLSIWVKARSLPFGGSDSHRPVSRFHCRDHQSFYRGVSGEGLKEKAMANKQDSESTSYDEEESDYNSEEQEERGEASDARSIWEARIASIMDVLQDI